MGVVIVDDHKIMREALRSLVESAPGIAAGLPVGVRVSVFIAEAASKKELDQALGNSPAGGDVPSHAAPGLGVRGGNHEQHQIHDP